MPELPIAQPGVLVAQPVAHAEHRQLEIEEVQQPNEQTVPSFELTIPSNSAMNNNSAQVELDYMAMYYKLDQVNTFNTQLLYKMLAGN